MTETDVDARRDRLGLELIGVIAVSYAASGLDALLNYIRIQVETHGHISTATATVVQAAHTTYPWLDLADDLASILTGFAAPFLALVLLARSPAGIGFGIGLDRIRRTDLTRGAGLAALIGLPGLGLVWFAHAVGLNAQLDVVDFPDVWYRVPVLILNAFQDGVGEEVVVLAYVLTRLRQLGWSDSRALGASAVLRGSYHLYQGIGGFFGNLVMGLIFGWLFQRTRRAGPMIVAHTLIDAVSFIGYIYLKSRISWI